jgi:hypothetical protein
MGQFGLCGLFRAGWPTFSSQQPEVAPPFAVFEGWVTQPIQRTFPSLSPSTPPGAARSLIPPRARRKHNTENCSTATVPGRAPVHAHWTAMHVGQFLPTFAFGPDHKIRRPGMGTCYMRDSSCNVTDGPSRGPWYPPFGKQRRVGSLLDSSREDFPDSGLLSK